MQTSRITELESLQPTALDAGEVFSGTPSGHQVQGFASPNPFTPIRDPNYIFHESSRDLIVWFINSTDPLYVFGPCGSGKTSSIKQLAARLNYIPRHALATGAGLIPRSYTACSQEIHVFSGLKRKKWVSTLPFISCSTAPVLWAQQALPLPGKPALP
jgi:hypothetical protein